MAVAIRLLSACTLVALTSCARPQTSGLFPEETGGKGGAPGTGGTAGKAGASGEGEGGTSGSGGASGEGGSGGTAGTSGTGGAGGTAGTSGTGGSGGTGGSSGTAGASGNGGTGGTSGTGGIGGASGTGGTGGIGGSSGTGGNGGSGGIGGVGGTSGTGGTGGNGGSGGIGGVGGTSGTGGTGGIGGTGGAAGSGGTAGTSGAGGAGGTCSALDAALTRRTTYVEFVLDATGSMVDDNKWWVMGTAFDTALPGFSRSLRVGATIFPGLDGNTSNAVCYAAKQQVAFATPGNALTRSFENAFERDPRGGSPTRQALTFGYGQLRTAASWAKADRVAVLITDGSGNYDFGPTGDAGKLCTGDGYKRSSVDQELLVEDVARALQTEAIYTLVIGLPGTEAHDGSLGYRDILSRVAVAGGTGECEGNGDDCHIDLSPYPDNLEDVLRWTLSALGKELQSCRFALPAGVTNPGANATATVATSSTATMVPRVNEAACLQQPNATGFIVQNGELFLCAASCAEAREKNAIVTLHIPCD